MDSGAPRRRRRGSLVHRRTRFGSGDTTGVWILMPPIDPDPKIRRNLKLFQEFGWTRPEPWASITHWGKHRIVPQLQSPHGEYRASVSSDDIMFWGPSSDFPLFIITMDTEEPPPPKPGYVKGLSPGTRWVRIPETGIKMQTEKWAVGMDALRDQLEEIEHREAETQEVATWATKGIPRRRPSALPVRVSQHRRRR